MTLRAEGVHHHLPVWDISGRYGHVRAPGLQQAQQQPMWQGRKAPLGGQTRFHQSGFPGDQSELRIRLTRHSQTITGLTPGFPGWSPAYHCDTTTSPEPSVTMQLEGGMMHGGRNHRIVGSFEPAVSHAPAVSWGRTALTFMSRSRAMRGHRNACTWCSPTRSNSRALPALSRAVSRAMGGDPLGDLLQERGRNVPGPDSGRR